MRCLIPSLVITLALCACGHRRPAQPPEPDAASTPAAPAPANAPSAALSAATSPDAYKVEMARRIYAASADIATGPPQDLLRAVIVLNVTIDSNGQPGHIAIQRSPGDAEAEQRAIQSVWRGAPYARPSNALLRGAGSFELSETWLFNDDGRFQLRSVAPLQTGG